MVLCLGENLASLRLSQGLSLGQLAKKLGISKSSIAYYENNSRMPSLDVLIKIADYFNVSIDFLLGRRSNDRPISDVDGLTYAQKQVVFAMISEFRKANDG